MNAQVSLFEAVYTSMPPRTVDFGTWLGYVRDGKWKLQVERARKVRLTNKREYDKIKTGSPNLKISGIFTQKNIQGLVKHSDLICMDFDRLDKFGLTVEQVKNKLKKFPFAYAIFTTISGNGLAMVVQTKITLPGMETGKEVVNRHYKIYAQIRKHLIDCYGIPEMIIDDTKDVTRFRAITYDPDLWVNENAKIHYFFEEKEEKKKTAPKAKVIQDKRKKAVEANVTINDYSDNQLLIMAEKATNDKMVFSEGQRNAWMHRFFNTCNLYGINREAALEYANKFGSPDFSINEIKGTLKSAYKSISYHGHSRPVARKRYKLQEESKPWHELSVFQYLNERNSELETLFAQHDKILLQAPTGCGKTKWIIEYAKNTGGKWLIAVNQRSIVDQERKNAGIGYVYGDQGHGDTLMNMSYDTIICTYDSLGKIIPKLINANIDYNLVIDESHSFIEDRTFRSKAIKTVQNAIDCAGKVVYMTATPDEYFAAALNVTHVKITRVNNIKKQIQLLECKNGEKFQLILTQVINMLKNGERVCVRMNDLAYLQSFKSEICNRKAEFGLNIKGSQIQIIHSEAINKECLNAIYDTGFVPEAVQIVLTTRLIDCGVNIKNADFNVIFVENNQEEVLPSQFIQFLSRFRNGAKSFAFMRRPRLTTNELPDILEHYNSEYAGAEELISVHYSHYNIEPGVSIHPAQTIQKISEDRVRYNSKSKCYEIDQAGVLFYAQTKTYQKLHTDDFIYYVQKFDPNIVFSQMDITSQQLIESEQLNAHTATKKKANELVLKWLCNADTRKVIALWVYERVRVNRRKIAEYFDINNTTVTIDMYKGIENVLEIADTTEALMRWLWLWKYSYGQIEFTNTNLVAHWSNEKWQMFRNKFAYALLDFVKNSKNETIHLYDLLCVKDFVKEHDMNYIFKLINKLRPDKIYLLRDIASIINKDVKWCFRLTQKQILKLLNIFYSNIETIYNDVMNVSTYKLKSNKIGLRLLKNRKWNQYLNEIKYDSQYVVEYLAKDYAQIA